MRTIISVRLSHLRNAEFFQLIDRVLMVFNSQFNVEYGFTRLIGLLRGMFDRFEVVFITNQANELTPDVRNADRHRDTFFKGLMQAIASFERIGNEEEREASIALQHATHPYRQAHNRSMVENSAQIRAFIFDMSQPANLARITTLKLTNRITELEDLNENFEDLFFARSESRSDLEQLRQLRREIAPLYRGILNRLISLYNIAVEDEETERAEALGEQIDRVNIVLAQVQNTLSRRVSRRRTQNANNPGETDMEDHGSEEEDEEKNYEL